MSKTTIIEVYQDKKGMYQFRLLARDGKLICSSEKYEKKAGAMSAAKKLSEWVSKATLVDADKKEDAASRTTGKQPVKKAANKTVASKVTSKKTATKQVVPVEA